MSLTQRLIDMPVQSTRMTIADQYVQVQYRESGAQSHTTPPLVLLHGIGSGAASWLYQLEAAGAFKNRVMAWEAPGYADSTALENPQPSAQDYALRLWAWLDALGIERVRLVGHSLGCIMAASAARLQSQRIASLTLLAPAQGYGPASQAVRSKMVNDRLGMLAELGAEKMAQVRAPAMLSPNPEPQHLALACYAMARLRAAGYAQATHMLSQAEIEPDLRTFCAHSDATVMVACGELDTVTTAKSCRALAQTHSAQYRSLGDAGHLCTVQANAQVNVALGLLSARA